MFERLTDESRAVLRLGREEARASGHRQFGSEHILLGLASEARGVTGRALTSLGIDQDRVYAEIEQMNRSLQGRSLRSGPDVGGV